MDTNSCQLDFEGKTAIVTGSTRGIGRAIADLLWDCGASVIYTGTKRFSEVAAGDRKDYWQLNASDSSSLEALQTSTLDLPKLDILVNNAGINRVDSVDGLDDEDWSTVIDVNLTAPMKLMRSATKVMKNAGPVADLECEFFVWRNWPCQSTLLHGNQIGPLGRDAVGWLGIGSRGDFGERHCSGIYFDGYDEIDAQPGGTKESGRSRSRWPNGQ